MNKAGNSASQPHQPDRKELGQKATANLEQQEELCRGLEAIADGLPSNVDIGRCNKFAAELVASIKNIHEFEEKSLFPYILTVAKSDATMPGVIERLRFEHWEDQAYAEEVQQALQGFAKAPESSNVESLSWMLRGFFEGVRRHIAFERSYLLPLVAA